MTSTETTCNDNIPGAQQVNKNVQRLKLEQRGDSRVASPHVFRMYVYRKYAYEYLCREVARRKRKKINEKRFGVVHARKQNYINAKQHFSKT